METRLEPNGMTILRTRLVNSSSMTVLFPAREIHFDTTLDAETSSHRMVRDDTDGWSVSPSGATTAS